MWQKANAKQQPNTSNHWKQATDRQVNINDSTAMIDNRPAIDATEAFSSARSEFALGHGLGDTLHTGNHRQLDASGIDMQNIARQATTARNAPIKVTSTAREHAGKTKQVNIDDSTAMIGN